MAERPLLLQGEIVLYAARQNPRSIATTCKWRGGAGYRARYPITLSRVNPRVGVPIASHDADSDLSICSRADIA
ncbi:hypothetical protein AWB80_04033 [Caballeronia pedi]|uniref:Uncharacterized protein n=1 Tax=Caballeronia pedi TaxID=1777141 RepID=A0A158BSE0_9BURK|nr:hypothetical protein AWB80_04033 [Caballeronia pedi]